MGSEILTIVGEIKNLEDLPFPAASASTIALLTSGVGFSRPAVITLALASLVVPH